MMEEPNAECAQEFANSFGLVCRECGEPIEFDLWLGNLGPLCQRCHEKIDVSD